MGVTYSGVPLYYENCYIIEWISILFNHSALIWGISVSICKTVFNKISKVLKVGGLLQWKSASVVRQNFSDSVFFSQRLTLNKNNGYDGGRE